MSAVNASHPCPQCGGPLPDSGFAGLCPRCVAGSLSDTWDLLSGAVETPAVELPVVRGWKILGPLGAGGQGIVWRAVRETDDLPAALKIFRADRSGGVESGARMETEAAALAGLNHECIVAVLDSGTTEDERFFIATELVEGCDLHRLLQAERLPPARALHIAVCVARALEHAHGRGLIHRDVKPGNVLTDRAGTVKLADFSLAKDASGGARRISVTADGTSFGTPYYLAPEVMRGAPAGVAADLYALGVMLYEMLTGAPPAGRFARISEKCDLPREADALVESLLSENPEKRPATASAVLTKLEHLQQSLAGAAAARVRRRRWQLTAAAAGLALIAGATGYFAPRPQPPPPPLAKLNAKGFPNPAAATRAEPFLNSLGMAFIPVPRTNVLFCRHETRRSDWLAYLDGIRDERDEWVRAYGGNTASRRGLNTLTADGWVISVFDTEDIHQVLGNVFGKENVACGVSYPQAQRFCAWLTWREQREGRLSPGEYYRLPSDEEWSAAAGLPKELGATPEERHQKLPPGEPIYPWGTDQWPPSPGFGNYAGIEARDSTWPEKWLSLIVRNDDFARVAPPGLFGENPNGLQDLWGNVWEWTESRRNLISNSIALRGASWVDGGYSFQFRRDFRRFEDPARRQTDTGFRPVLVVHGK